MKTVVEHMIDVLWEQHRSVVSFGERALLDECARRCTHTTLMEVSPGERDNRIFAALENSGKFNKSFTFSRGSTPQTKRRDYRVRVMTLKEEIGQ